jgi:c-di-GMP-binding flagellar brake protein YcgR
MDKTPTIERRKALRIPTVLPICFEWRSAEKEIRHTRGSTRDISRFGVYCFLEDPLSPGLHVDFDVVFPRELTATDPMRLWCGGNVLRSEIQERRFGLVASIDTHKIMDAEDETSDSDRRSHLRVVPPEAIVAEYPGLRSVIRDLSPTGAFIEDNRPFPVGHVIDLRLRGDSLSAPIQVKAIVRRVEPQMGMAVEFVALAPATRQTLRDFISKSRPPRVELATN